MTERRKIRRRKMQPADDPGQLDLRILTRQHVEAVVREFGPDRAWIKLGVSRSTLYRWRKEWRRMDEIIAIEEGKVRQQIEEQT